MSKRWVWFWILLLVSLALTVGGTILLRNPFLLLFLFLPFGPWLFGRGEAARPVAVRGCERCDFRTDESWMEYCPRDGSRLTGITP